MGVGTSSGRYNAGPTSPLPMILQVGLRRRRCLAAFGLLLGLLDVVEGKSEGGGETPTRTGVEPNSRDAGVEAEGAEAVAFMIPCRYSYRRINATAPFLHQRRSGALPRSAWVWRRCHSQRFGEAPKSGRSSNWSTSAKGPCWKRMMKCGKAWCACSSDPTASVMGPTSRLTHKSKGKMVNVPSPRRRPLPYYKAASRGGGIRKLKTLLSRLEKLSQTILRHPSQTVAQSQQSWIIAEAQVIPYISGSESTSSCKGRDHSNRLIFIIAAVVPK